MPPEVAKQVISRWTGAAWVENPVAPWWFGNLLDSRRTYCDTDQTPQPMPFREITIVGFSTNLEVRRFISICKRQQIILRTNSEQERNDLMDAFISLGAKALVSENDASLPDWK